jgi:hypothetical protein
MENSSNTSFFGVISEPSSVADSAASSRCGPISEPSSVLQSTASEDTSRFPSISEPRSVEDTGASSFMAPVSEPSSIAVKKRKSGSASGSETSSSGWGVISEPETGESEVSEIFRDAREKRRNLLEGSSSSCSISSSFASQAKEYSEGSSSSGSHSSSWKDGLSKGRKQRKKTRK